jgi:glycosyltransferase involved in cell wall biosynthesis
VRVLYLTMNPNRESTTVPTEGWFRLLGPRGLEPVLVSRQSGAFQEWARAQGVPTYETEMPFPSTRWPFPFISSLLRLRAIARRHRPELVHCNEHDVYPAGQYLARMLGIPVAVSVHFTLRDGFSRWAFSGRRAPDRMFFVSRSCLEACRPDVGGIVDESHWRVLHNGLNLDHYQPDQQRGLAFRREHGLESARVLGVACALRPRKQLEHLFQAVHRLDDPSVHVVVAGGPVSGDEAYAERLLQDARALLGERLIYLGHLRELRFLYNALDLFVNTSQEESFGLSVLEAMACGCPVVGYPSVSVSEVVLPNGGEIVAQDDIPALVTAIRAWLRRPDLLTNARNAARAQSGLFDIAAVAAQLWQEYEEVLATGSRKS